MKLTMSGVPELEKKLKEAANMDDVKNMVKLNGSEMQKEAMRKAPVDTGNLKRYIMLSVHDGGFSVRIKALVNYASYPEYGTRYQSAQPYIRPAYYKQRKKFVKDLMRLMK